MRLSTYDDDDVDDDDDDWKDTYDLHYLVSTKREEARKVPNNSTKRVNKETK